MKRGTDRKLKFLLLQQTLAIPAWQVKGLLQSLWDFASENAAEGDVGRFTNVQLALGMGLDAAQADTTIGALTATKWLDADHEFRLVIHDWDEHCEEWVKKRVARAGKEFANAAIRARTPVLDKPTRRRKVSAVVEPAAESVGQIPTESAVGRNLSESGGQKSPASSSSSSSSSSSASALASSPSCALAIAQPEPLPEPPDPPSADGRASAEEIYRAYPRHVAKGAALKATRAAIGNIVASTPKTPGEAVEWLLGRVVAYAASPMVRTTPPDYLPHLSTWMNEARYHDDDSEWNRERVRGDAQGKGHRPTPQAEADARRTAQAAREYAEPERAIPILNARGGLGGGGGAAPSAGAA